AATQRQLARGQRTVELLKQPQYQPLRVEHQVVSIYAVTNGYLDAIPVEKVGAWERGFLAFLDAERKDLLDGIRTGKTLTDEIETKVKGAIDDFNARFEAEQAAA